VVVLKISKLVPLLLFFILILFLFSPFLDAEPILEGEIKAGLSVGSKDCKLESGSIICSGTSDEGEGFIPYFFETLVDVNLSGLLGPGDNIRSVSEFYHPYTPYSGLTFQGLTYETLVGEIASLEGEVIFSPNIILYTTPDRRTDWYGATFPTLAFRRYRSSIKFSLVGLTADTTLIVENWQDKPEDPENIQSGVIFELSGETEDEVELGMKARFGAKEGVTCFGNCLGPLKLQQVALQEGMGFEEFVFSVDDLPIQELHLSLSGGFSSDHGFNGLALRGSKTWECDQFDFTLSSSLSVTSNTFLPFAGTSMTWSADPIIFSVYFDESFQLKNAAKSLQVTPDVSELGIEGLNLSGQGLLGEKLNISITIPTDPVDFTTAVRLGYEDGFYRPQSGLLRCVLTGDPFSAIATVAVRGDSRVFRLETEMEF